MNFLLYFNKCILLCYIYISLYIYQIMLYFAKYLIKNARITSVLNKINFKGNSRFYNILVNDIPDISVTTIKRALKSNNVTFEEGHTCLIIGCPICNNKPAKSQNKKVYINKTTGLFSCHSCHSTGPWNILQKFLSSTGNLKEITKYSFTKDSKKYKNIISNSSLVKSDEIVESICKKFSLPIVPSNFFSLLNIRINESQNCLYVPLLDVEGNVSGFRILELKTSGEGKEIVKERTEPAHDCNGLIVGRVSRSRESTGVIVPNFRDFLSLLVSRVPYSIICLPYSLSTLPISTLPSLERFSRLVLWFEGDATSWGSARAFAKKLGEPRCYLVKPTDQQQLPHKALEDAKDLKGIINGAQPIWHKSITNFAALRQDVLSDLQNLDRVQGVKWTRFPTLNKILKGHRRGELTVITGPTGCGKTTFISEYSLDLALQGVSTLWGSFEIRNARLARTMLQQLSGFALDEHLDKFDEFADQFERLPIYFMTFHGQQPIKVVMEAVEHATYVHDIIHVIIDNVQFMMGMSESETRHVDRFWKQDAIVAAFRMFATRRNCHVTLVIHPRKERDEQDLTTSSIFGGAKASQEADNVLIIQDKRLTSVRGKKYLQVAKNRYSGDLGVMPMEFDKNALSYAPKKKKPTDTNLVNPNEETSSPVNL